MLAKQGIERTKVSRAETWRISLHELLQKFYSLRAISGPRIAQACIDPRSSNSDMQYVQRWPKSRRSSSHISIASIIQAALESRHGFVFKSGRINRGYKQVNGLTRTREISSSQRRTLTDSDEGNSRMRCQEPEESMTLEQGAVPVHGGQVKYSRWTPCFSRGIQWNELAQEATI